KKHRSFKPEQKARAVLQVLTGQKSAAQICRELQIGESLLSRRKKQFLDGASSVFEKESNPAQDDERVAELERLVGRLTLELEASKKVAAICSKDSSTETHFPSEPGIEAALKLIEIGEREKGLQAIQNFGRQYASGRELVDAATRSD